MIREIITNSTDFGRAVRFSRKARGLSQRALAVTRRVAKSLSGARPHVSLSDYL